MTAPHRSGAAASVVARQQTAVLRDISVRALQAFVVVAQLGSFREAGDALFLDASTVSKLVTRLERALGTRLLTRSTRRVALTQTGAAALTTAREVLAAVDRFEAAARNGR